MYMVRGTVSQYAGQIYSGCTSSVLTRNQSARFLRRIFNFQFNSFREVPVLPYSVVKVSSMGTPGGGRWTLPHVIQHKDLNCMCFVKAIKRFRWSLDLSRIYISLLKWHIIYILIYHCTCTCLCLKVLWWVREVSGDDVVGDRDELFTGALWIWINKTNLQL